MYCEICERAPAAVGCRRPGCPVNRDGLTPFCTYCGSLRPGACLRCDPQARTTSDDDVIVPHGEDGVSALLACVASGAVTGTALAAAMSFIDPWVAVALIAATALFVVVCAEPPCADNDASRGDDCGV